MIKTLASQSGKNGRHRKPHVVWDWNGTLFNDAQTTIELTIEALTILGAVNLTPAILKSGHKRPLAAKFSGILGRPISTVELEFVLARYAAQYECFMFELSLASEARGALACLEGHCDQSILSLAPQAQLDQLVSFHGISRFFSRISGSTSLSDVAGKKERLLLHCEELGVCGNDVIMIGDTIEDFEAGEFVGANTILVPCGIQSADQLIATGSIVKDCIQSAATEALTLIGDVKSMKY